MILKDMNVDARTEALPDTGNAGRDAPYGYILHSRSIRDPMEPP